MPISVGETIMFESDPKKARESLEAMRRAEMEACPDPLKPYLSAVEKARDRAVQAITEKNRWLFHLRELERSLDGISEGAAKENRLKEIENARDKLREGQQRVEDVRIECLAAEEEYLNAGIEHRIRHIPEFRRKAAFALLDEEQNELQALYMEPSTEGGHVGSVGGAFIGLDLRVKEAERRGDKEALAHLLPLREKAKGELEKVEAAIAKRDELGEEIRRAYDARLQSLVDEPPAS